MNRSSKWGTVRLWTPTGSASTSRQSWTLKKPARFSSKTEVFFERSTLTAGILGVQRHTLPHFKDLFKIFKMRYSMSLYSDGIVFKFRFQKSHFTTKKGYCTRTYVYLCITPTQNRASKFNIRFFVFRLYHYPFCIYYYYLRFIIILTFNNWRNFAIIKVAAVAVLLVTIFIIWV